MAEPKEQSRKTRFSRLATLSAVKRKHALTHNGQGGFTRSKVRAQKRKYGNSAPGLLAAAGAHTLGLRLQRAGGLFAGTWVEWSGPGLRVPSSRAKLWLLGMRAISLRSGFLLCRFNRLDSFPRLDPFTSLINLLELARKDKEESS